MSDLLKLAEKAVNPEFEGEEYLIAGYIKDFARALIAARELADACDSAFDNIDAVGTREFYVALAAFRAALQESTND